MRICIVTPGHLASNPRVVKEATCLAGAGHQVHVVHGHYAPWALPFDKGLVQGFTRTIVPFGPILAPRSTYLRQSLVRRVAYNLSRMRALRQALADTAIAAVARDLAAAVSKVPADLYIAHYTPALAAVAQAAARHHAAYAFDAEDFHPGDLPEAPEHAHAKSLIDTVERQTLPGAAFVTAASPGIADAYAERYQIPRPQVVLNVFPRAEAPPAPSRKGIARPGPSIYWFSQTVGRSRGLECALRAIAMSRAHPHLYLRGVPAPGYAESLMALARELGVSARLHFLPPEAPDRMVTLAARYDLGLVGEEGLTINRRIALTNKQFTYLLAGLPTILSDIPAHGAFAQDAEGAAFLYRVDEPAQLARQIDALLCDADALTAARREAFAAGQNRFNWEFEQEKLLAVVAKVAAEPPAC